MAKKSDETAVDPTQHQPMSCANGKASSLFNPSPGLQVTHNYDLMHSIFTQARGRFGMGMSTSEFASLLRVNRNFYHILIEYVWESIPSFLPLFRLLPSFAERDTGVTLEGLSPNDWVTWNERGRHIKDVSFQQRCPLEDLPEQLLTQLISKSAATPLLPNVRTIWCDHKAVGAIRLLPLAMGPKLRILSVELRSFIAPMDCEIPDDWEEEEEDEEILDSAHSLLASAALMARNLDYLIYLGPLNQPLIHILADLQHLTSLDLTYTCIVSLLELSFIGSLSSLKSLSLHTFHRDVDQEDLAGLKRRNNLPNLRSFSATGSAAVLSAYNTLFAPRTLRHYYVIVLTVGDEGFDCDLVLQDNAELQGFTVQGHPFAPFLDLHGPWPVESQTRLLDSLEARLPTLKEIEISNVGILGEEITGRMRRRLLEHDENSALTKLYFDIPTGLWTQDHLSDWSATPQTLFDLALHGCRTIKHLEIHFNSHGFSQSGLPAIPPGFKGHGLETLSLITDGMSVHFDLSLSDKIAAAVFLDALFPSLVRVDATRGTMNQDWDEINELVQSYRKKRELGREGRR